MTVKQLVTAEELWEMPEQPGVRYELVAGELVEVPGTGALHGLIMALVYELIRNFSRERQLGLTFADNTSYILHRQPDVLRIPDVSFIAWEHVPAAGVPEGFWDIAPDLAVEVVSPGDRADDIHNKVHEYLEAGTRLVWVLWPRRRSVSVYEPDGIAHELASDDYLAGGEVLPGFRVQVAALFAVERTHPGR